MESREERMRQRLRGAGRKDGVEDISFGPLLPDIEDETTVLPETTPANASRRRETRGTKSSSAKAAMKRASGAVADSPQDTQRSTAKRKRTSKPGRESADETTQVQATVLEDDLDTLPEPTPRHSSGARRSSGERRSSGSAQVVEESPTHAPGSGKRRSLDSSGTGNSSRRLQRMLASVVEDEPTQTQTTSSPLARKSKGETTRSMRSSTLRRTAAPLAEEDEEDELSPNVTRHPEPVDDLAEEIDDQEAARVLGRKRPRRSVFRKPSPEPEPTILEEQEAPEAPEAPEAEEPELPDLDREDEDELVERQQDIYEVSDNEPAPKRRKKTAPASPAKQKQPRRKEKPAPKKKGQDKTSKAPEDEADDLDDGNTISVTIQRLTKPRRVVNEDGADEADELNAEIPFANLKDPNVVDVLAQSIDEVITQNVDKLKEIGMGTEDSAVRKECRVKIKGLEAFRGEVQTQLLGHTIKLSYLHQLNARIKSTEKERQKLRDEVITMRKEQEDLHVRMDMARDEHEGRTQKQSRRVEMSTMMHDVQLAIDRGRERSPMSAAKRKQAELTNLEMQIAAIADVVCTRGNSGGLAKQIEDFNQFLERTEATIMKHNSTKQVK